MKKMKTPPSPVRTLLCQDRESSLVKAVYVRATTHTTIKLIVCGL